jgi:hypothetical protein
MADTKVSALTEVSVAELEDLLYLVEDPTGTPTSRKLSGSRLGGMLDPGCNGGRLTLTSALPVTTADVTGATTIYFTPYRHNRISLFDGTRWRRYVFAELSLALGTLTSGKPYDVFLYDNAGTLTLEFLVWTNDTTRATALARQDGVWCKTGALTRRYLGTFYTTATTTTEDSGAQRYLWNAENRVLRPLQRFETTGTWTWATGLTYHQANAAAANQVALIVGLLEDAIRIHLSVKGETSSAGDSALAAIGEDSTTAPIATAGAASGKSESASVSKALVAEFVGLPSAVGRHAYVWLEAVTGGTATFYGAVTSTILRNRYGLTGHVLG